MCCFRASDTSHHQAEKLLAFSRAIYINNFFFCFLRRLKVKYGGLLNKRLQVCWQVLLSTLEAIKINSLIKLYEGVKKLFVNVSGMWGNLVF